MAMKGYSAFPKAAALLEPYHQIVSVICRTLVGECLSSLQWCRWCVLQLLQTGPQDTHWGSVLPLCKDAVGIFYSLSWLGYRTLIWECLTSLQRCSWCILQSSWLCHRTLIGGSVLPLCKDAVGVFYSPCCLGSPREKNHSFDFWQWNFLLDVWTKWWSKTVKIWFNKSVGYKGSLLFCIIFSCC